MMRCHMKCQAPPGYNKFFHEQCSADSNMRACGTDVAAFNGAQRGAAACRFCRYAVKIICHDTVCLPAAPSACGASSVLPVEVC